MHPLSRTVSAKTPPNAHRSTYVIERRILLTGSRDWPGGRRDDIHGALEVQLGIARDCGAKLVVVHGNSRGRKGNPGADRLAREWVERMQDQLGYQDVAQEMYDADWGRECDENCYHPPRHNYCPAAGDLRNQGMVDRGPYAACLAFPLGKSSGTGDCMRRARRAGIHVENLGDQPAEAGLW